MMRAIFLPFALLLMAPFVWGQEDFQMKEADRKKLGRSLGDWVEAKISGDFSGALDANEDLTKALEGIQKKLRGVPALACVADWEDILDSGRTFSSSGLKKGKSSSREAFDGSSFSVWIPKKYNPKKSNWPILVYATDKSADSVDDLPEAILERFVVIVPDFSSVPSDQMMGAAGRQKMLVPIGLETQELRLDRGRLFLLGEGALVDTAARYAAALPHLWAGCVLIGSAPTDIPKENLALLPFKDQVADLDAAAVWIAEGNRRSAYPLNFEFQPTESWAGRAFWVQAQVFDSPDKSNSDGEENKGGPARFKVSVDKTTNTIQIDAERVYQVDILLNDSIVDLSKPVLIVRNGETYEFHATRGLGTLLENFAAGMDAAAVFTARVRRLEIPSND